MVKGFVYQSENQEKLYSMSLFLNPLTTREESRVMTGTITRDVSLSVTGTSVHSVYTRDLSGIFFSSVD